MSLPRSMMAHIFAAWAFVCLGSAKSVSAQSLTEYVVSRGDSLSLIAQRLQVPVRILAHRNHLQEPYALRTGQTLRVPVVPGAGPPSHASVASAAPPANRHGDTIGIRGASSRGSSGPWGRPRHPGLVAMVREFNDERIEVNLRRPSVPAMHRMRRFLRFVDGASHDMDPRLLRQLAVVSDHFGGRALHVISGFRPFRNGQWTPHSNHNVGHAIDFRVEGVPNRVARDFCRTLPNTGCGFYPRSVFIHMDTRDESATWVDWSRPGQRPQYGSESHPPVRPGNASAQPANDVASATAGADEGLDDVVTSTPSIRSAVPDPDPETPAPADLPPTTAP